MEREYQIETTELTDDELAAVSGGYTLNNTMISGYVVAVGGGARAPRVSDGTTNTLFIGE